jgi:hypothetical protein
MHDSETPNSQKPPFSDEQIRVKAYIIWQERMATGGSPEDDWQAAIDHLQQERARLLLQQKPIHKLLFNINQPLIRLEKQVIEPIGEWFDRAAIFKIMEKLSPLLEVVGVLLIPVAVWWFSMIQGGKGLFLMASGWMTQKS